MIQITLTDLKTGKEIFKKEFDRYQSRELLGLDLDGNTHRAKHNGAEVMSIQLAKGDADFESVNDFHIDAPCLTRKVRRPF